MVVTVTPQERKDANVRLLHASALFEIPGLTISDVAHRLEYSSPQGGAHEFSPGAGSTTLGGMPLINANGGALSATD